MLFKIMTIMILSSNAQDYSLNGGFPDPGVGNGQDGVLNVPPGVVPTVINTTRAKVTDIVLSSTATLNYIHYENLVGTLNQGDLVMIINNATSPTTLPFQNHFLCRLRTSSSGTSGTIIFGHEGVGITNGTGNYDDVQMVKVMEYSSANLIEGTLTCPPYSETDGHGGVLAFLVDGNLEFGPDGKIDVTRKGHMGGEGGIGGTAGINDPAPPMSSAPGYAPGTNPTAGGDAVPQDLQIGYGLSRFGDKVEGFDQNCGNGETEITSPDGGKATGKVFGTEGTLGQLGVLNRPHDPQ